MVYYYKRYFKVNRNIPYFLLFGIISLNVADVYAKTLTVDPFMEAIV